jgi:hypothetical protein
MKPILILTILLLAATTAIAQQVVASAGNSGTATDYTIDWTLGEPVIETISGSDFTLTQGMHQTKLLVTAIDVLEIPETKIRVYPNPTGDWLIIEWIRSGPDEFRYELFDLAGRMMVTRVMQANPEMLEMGVFVPGLYLLRVVKSGSDYAKVFKIIRN